MDLVKAYELVPHHRILDGAIKFGFPARVLRVVFSVFLLARRICVEGCFSSSDILVPFSTIIAGSVFGPCFLRMSLQATIDAWQANWPLLQLYLYIDDMGILCQGPKKYIEVVFFTAVKQLDAALSQIDAAFSRGQPGVVGGKSIVVAPPCLVDILSGQFLNLGIAVNDHARNLGIDFFWGRDATQRCVQLAALRWSSAPQS